MFEKVGVVTAEDAPNISEDTLLEQLLDYDVKDIKRGDGTIEIICAQKSLDEVKQAVQSLGLKVTAAELEWVPKNTIELDSAAEERALEFLQALEDLEDVQDVYTNLA
jgi:transcriptional/translational regulatory protein YebC/TACO1